MSVLDGRNSYSDGVRRASSPSDEYDDASSCESSRSSSGSCSSSSSDLSEDVEWQQNVDSNGELFFVRAAAATAESPGRAVLSLPVQPSKGNSKDKFPVRLRWRHKQVPQSRNNGRDEPPNAVGRENPPKTTEKRYAEVVLTLNDKKPNLGRRSTQLELLLGIVPGRIEDISPSAFVSVRALVPGSQASRDRNVRIGDLIHKIQETEVTWSNLDEVLSSLVSSHSKQIKVTLATETLAISSTACGNVINKKSSEFFFPKLLTGQTDDDLRTSLLAGHDLLLPHGVLYLALGNSDSSSDLNEDIFYQYPAASNKLVPIRGALFTINHVVPDVFNSPPASSSILMDSQFFHVCYAREGKEVLLLAMPADFVTVYQLTKLTTQVVRSLKFQYETLHNCFTNKSHLNGLNCFFALFFRSNMQNAASSGAIDRPFKDRPFLKFFGFPQFLPLPTDLQCCISDILSELESSDFADLSEDHYEMRRLYNVLGSLLFYKGYLVSSHLSSCDVVRISLYLEGNGLLETSRDTSLSQVIVWREVHRDWISDHDRRWFLLVVGRNHCLVAALLEAGGCSMRAIGPQGPDPFYVEQCRSTLIQLEVRQVPASLDSWLDWPLTPLCASAESMALFQSGKVAKVNGVPDRLADQRPASKGLSASKLSLGSLSSWHQLHPEGNTSSGKKESMAIGETDSDTTSLSLTASGTSDDMTPILGRRERREDSDQRQSWSDANSQEDEEAGFVKSAPRPRYLPSVLDLANIADNMPSAAARDRNLAPLKLTFGPHNVLFHYVHMDSLEGVLVCPTRNFSVGQDLNAEVMQNFKSACLIIQQTLRTQFALENKETILEDDFYVENGLLFTVTPLPTIINKGNVNGPLTYWVVGRLFSRKLLFREFYVCYHDSCPQATIEMAFQLAFGLST